PRPTRGSSVRALGRGDEAYFRVHDEQYPSEAGSGHELAGVFFPKPIRKRGNIDMIAHPEPAEAQSVPDSLPLLPIRDLVVFPFLIVPLYVSRASSVAAVEEALAGDRLIFLAAQRNADEEAPGLDAIYPTGTVGIVMRMRKMQDGRIKILVQGLTKGRVGKLLQRAPCLRAEVER